MSRRGPARHGLGTSRDRRREDADGADAEDSRAGRRGSAPAAAALFGGDDAFAPLETIRALAVLDDGDDQVSGECDGSEGNSGRGARGVRVCALAGVRGVIELLSLESCRAAPALLPRRTSTVVSHDGAGDVDRAERESGVVAAAAARGAHRGSKHRVDAADTCESVSVAALRLRFKPAVTSRTGRPAPTGPALNGAPAP